METNLHYYRWYAIFFNGFAWTSLFFLYFTGKVGLAGALELEAIYYAGVVLFEVPSGYFSDRFGRRRTLILAALLLTVSYVVFFHASTFFSLACAQLALAAGFAFHSGSDTSFHYETLAAAGKPDQFEGQAAQILRTSGRFQSVCVLVGGLLSLIALKWAYALSGLCAFLALLCALRFKEPPEHRSHAPFVQQLTTCWRASKEPLLAYLLLFSVINIVSVHMPYELIQPYLQTLLPPDWPTALSSALILSASAYLGATVATWGPPLARRYGLQRLLLGSQIYQMALVALMGLAVHPIIALLTVTRSMSSNLTRSTVITHISAALPATTRATYLSMQSLLGRLSFSAVLWLLARVAQEDDFGILPLTSASVLLVALGALAMVGWFYRSKIRQRS